MSERIRNALQSMVGLNYPQETVAQIEAAVKRIDGALRDLLPIARVQWRWSEKPSGDGWLLHL